MRCFALLIAPVWNWNFKLAKHTRLTWTLLIAPVWNWNWLWCWLHNYGLTFNRTSLELKLQQHDGHRQFICLLLIAPVWNWNSTVVITWNRAVSLLIAPVWNWNRARHRWHAPPGRLLIAPVWNWNRLPRVYKISDQVTFNRTSLELKRACERPSGKRVSTFNRTSLELKRAIWLARLRADRLLIAPVWNWNGVSGRYKWTVDLDF